MPSERRKFGLHFTQATDHAISISSSAAVASSSSSSISSQTSHDAKVCADCARHIPPEQSIPFEQAPTTTTTLCSGCRETRINLDALRGIPVVAPPPPPVEATYDYPMTPSTVSSFDISSSVSSLEEHRPLTPPRVVNVPFGARPLLAPPSPSPSPPTSSFHNHHYHHQQHQRHHHRQQRYLQQPATSSSYADYSGYPDQEEEDLYTDITHLRVPQRGQHCLYSGATFRGVQKSGRNSYEVTVNILDVDFPTSHLSGYLTISGLTEDYPTLTTYFDAEIIGPQYGFLTAYSNPTWGASEAEDMTHWNRFAPFRWSKVQRSVHGPGLFLDDDSEMMGEKGCVFMRWKEKFLVPDHRVKDINGASFAGFYYVCVEFNPKERIPLRCPSSSSSASSCPYHHHSHHSHSHHHHSHHNHHHHSREPEEAPTASMTGYYFHQNSEPYQQLSLHHVPDTSNGSFEFR